MSKKLINKVNAIYNRQIAKNEHYIIDKKLFNYSLELSLLDWKEIRSGDFWEKMDNMKIGPAAMEKYESMEKEKEGSGEFYYKYILEVTKKRFTLRKIEQYLRSTK